MNDFLSRFVYERGGLLDGWRIVETKGDCDDFALTVLWHLCGRRWWLVAWRVLTFQAVFWRVASPSNKGLARIFGRHLVLKYKGQWIDSTFPEWRDDLAPHSKRLPCSPPWVLFRVIWGAL